MASRTRRLTRLRTTAFPIARGTVKPIFGWDASDFDSDVAGHIVAAAKEGIRFFTYKATEQSPGGITRHVRFKASVDAQGGAYATGVLVLMSSAALAVAITAWRRANRWPRA